MVSQTADHYLKRSMTFFFALAASFAMLYCSAGNARAAQATLTWRAPTTYEDGTPLTSIGGYKIYEGTSSGNYSQITDVGNVTSYTVNGLTDGATYYFALAAYDSGGTVSGLSNEMNKTFTATYSITATAGAGGAITAQGAATNQATNGTSTVSTVSVAQGASQTFAITPATGYTIAGVTVDGASVGAVTTYTFSNVTASHTIAATFAAAGGSTSTSTAPVFAIDAGGPAFTGTVAYQADARFSGGTTATTTAAISGTTDGTVYKTERYGNFSYNVPLTNGNYLVTLKFAEFYWSAAGKRVFNVTMNGQTVISNLDIYAKVGKNVAYDVTVPATVTNGTLNIGFVTLVDNAKVSGIVVTPAAAGTPTPAGTTVFADNAGGSSFTSPSGITYAADSKFSGGSIGTTTATISGTTDGTLYKTERYGNFSYAIPVPNGTYDVTLKFAEIYWAAPGKRIFSVALNGQTVIDRLDLYAKVGKNVAYDVVVPATVTNGTINLNFTTQADNAKISGIVVKTH